MAERTPGTSKVRFSRLIGLTAAVASLVLMTAAPAHAVGANEGVAINGTGYEDDIVLGTDFGNPPSVLCFEVTANTNHLDFANDEVTANATTTSPSATAQYTKNATFEWHINQTMYINPDGAFSGHLTAPNGCDYSTKGDPIAATATFHGANGSGEVTCLSGDGGATYSRIDTNVQVTFTGTCTVDGDGAQGIVTTPSEVTSTLTATEVPCITPPNSCEHSTLNGSFEYH